MKILYVAHGDYWGSTWPFSFIDRYIVESLAGLGHQVKVFDVFARVKTLLPYYRAYAEKHKLNGKQIIQLMDERAMAELPFEVLDFEPDLVLRIVGRLSSRILSAIRKTKTKTAIWYLDDPQEIDFTSKDALKYDYVFTVESACVAAYKQAGSQNAFFLPLGCSPAIQKKLEVEDKYKSDICFIGVAFPARVEFFDSVADSLKDHNVKIIGGGKTVGSAKDPWLWGKKLKRLDVLGKFIVDEIVQPEEAAKYYNGAKINLNIHRAAIDARITAGNKSGIVPQGVSGRTFEIAGCAGFQLIDNARSDYSKHFEVGKEIVAFSDVEDFKKKVKYYLQHDEERMQIAEAAQKRAYADHTYKQRLNFLIEKCA
ncbi:MAG: glycosyltransferase [Candidatus Margulisbacteria bacterium]|nr:glycosyltransferase [Candidatus Margulisiibacteriota bacterium]